MLPTLTNPVPTVRCMHWPQGAARTQRRTSMDITLVGHTYKDVALARSTYGDGSLAVTLDDKHGEPVTTVSAWLPVPPSDGCVWVKDYSENAGVLEQCIEAGVLETTGRVQASGFVELQEARVLV